ncbi:MAG: hypothetical protein ACT4OJ_09505 [Bacteroidota bacterium]
MKKTFIYLLLPLLLASCSHAQQQSFDITSYTAPANWKKQASDGGLQYSIEDAKGNFCIITLFRSIAATDNPKTNFDAAWDDLVKGMVKVSSAPEMQPAAEEDGWEVRAGYDSFESDDTKGIALLTTTSGYGKMVNILILTNSDVFEKDMTAFLESVSFKKTGSTGRNEQTAGTEPATKQDGYAFTTTNFDDGWNSTVQKDWVEVTKGNIKVYLWYALPYNASDFSGTGLVERDYYWDNHVSKYFTIQTKQYQDNGEYIGSLKPRYVEGWAKNKQTGEKVFIAMRLSIAPNAAYIVIAAAPDESSIRNQFPKANDKYTSDLAAMDSYNKFAVGKNDLTGTWVSGGNGAMLTWYSTTTGNNVGSTAVAKSDVFRFSTGASYSSTHNGATGWVGSMNTYQQEYKGTYTVTDWTVTATNRWDKKTEKFDAWFEIVRGGRVLHLDTPGIKYTLFKEK